MKEQFSVGIVVYFKGKEKIEYLLLHYEFGHWDFPKGKIEPGETKQETALRELKEETGLDVDLEKGFDHSFSYIFTDKFGDLVHKTVYFFVGQTETKKIKLSFEHIGFDWLEFEPAFQKLTYKNAKQLLEKADKFLKSFAL